MDWTQESKRSNKERWKEATKINHRENGRENGEYKGLLCVCYGLAIISTIEHQVGCSNLDPHESLRPIPSPSPEIHRHTCSFGKVYIGCFASGEFD